MRSLQVLIIASSLGIALGSARAQAIDPVAPNAAPAPPPRSVYEVDLSLDIPIILAGATAGLLRTYLGNHIVDQRCPCNADEVNAFDRHVIGNTATWPVGSVTSRSGSPWACRRSST